MADKKRQLDELRTQLGKIDRAILERLEERARASRQIHALLEGEAPSLDRSEAQGLAALVEAASGVLSEDAVRAIFSEIFAVGRALEQPVRVAYLGPEGGFCHAVAEQQFGVGTTYLESATVGDALEEVARGRAVYAVFPFESSVEGLVQPSINALEQTDLVMVAERAMPATYSLMSRTENIADIDKIFATAAAHAACERFLERELAKVTIIDVRSPVVAAQMSAEDHGTAAIVPEPAGRAVGLGVVRANIGDTADMRFRYGVAGVRPASRSGNDTTCLLFSVDDTPGALYDVLRHFAERGTNLKKLQSRPVSGQGWDYVFYAEVSGHITDRAVVTALEAIKRSTKYLRVLGSFATSE
jgi:chorismate mutase/prephenate dehydratase